MPLSSFLTPSFDERPHHAGAPARDYGVTPFFKRIFPYFAHSPVITIAKAFCARS
ncbi:hypothetical protein CKO_04167 [Citrobacter koseri ATCC BAA-895]|uniref:Uncharacterized protein n=1 Tax=Citrobacter koseri (strain ATCC BAA-895 / CDC 4225-83 / SGSC4696) TaxID=290338 RepID=A8AP18_CITK8|nr:hypothetical protein CKO_04167 [Citrobacter koseri ATCC BAA-895]